jgi:ribosomal protein S8E
VRRVRVRGGNVKWRALRLDTGNYSWGSEAVTRKTRILDVVYNASNNELVRTQTLVKSAIVQVDAAPFKQWYLTHYGVDIGRKKKAPAAKKDAAEVSFFATQVHCCFVKIMYCLFFYLVRDLTTTHAYIYCSRLSGTAFIVGRFHFL